MFITNFLKKILFIAMAFAVSATCFALPQNGFRIKGFSQSKDGIKIIFSNALTNVVIDSTTVKNGEFYFKGTVKEPFIGWIDDSEFGQAVIIEPGKISVVMGYDGNTSGTPLNDKMSAYDAEYRNIANPFHRRSYALMRDSTLTEEKKKELDKELTTQFHKFQEEFTIKTLKENNNILGILYYTMFMGSCSDEDYFNKISEITGDKVKSSDVYKQVAKIIETKKQNIKGKMFTDFTIPNGNIDGTSISLSDYVGKGKYILVDFWASWCGPCRAEIPNIKENYIKYAGEKFDVVSIAVSDKRDDTLKAIEEEQLPWNQIIDTQSVPFKLYGFNSIPLIMLFAPDGTIYSNSLRGKEIGKTLQAIFNR